LVQRLREIQSDFRENLLPKLMSRQTLESVHCDIDEILAQEESYVRDRLSQLRYEYKHFPNSRYRRSKWFRKKENKKLTMDSKQGIRDILGFWITSYDTHLKFQKLDVDESNESKLYNKKTKSWYCF